MNFNTDQLRQYIKQIKEIEEYILYYLEEKQENDMDIVNEDDLYKKLKTNKYLLKIFLHMISHISNNHQRFPDFFKKIENILREFKLEIQKYFTNLEIFRTFERNKRILLFLFEENFLIKEISILSIIHNMNNDYEEYLFPSNDNEDQEIFDRKRKIGENDSYICELIRDDNIIEFIKYVNQTNYPLNSKIKSSIFETNPIFFNEPTLIQYSAFFGSIQIFQFLRFNNVELTPSLWQYAIHSNNAELIHLLEEILVDTNDSNNNIYDDFNRKIYYEECPIELISWNHLNLMHYYYYYNYDYDYYNDNNESKSFQFLLLNMMRYFNNKNNNYKQCLIESIKCHHLNLMHYFDDNFTSDYFFFFKGLHYYNMSYFENHSLDFINEESFLRLFIYNCIKYDYIEIVKSFIEILNNNIDKISILNLIFFNYIFISYLYEINNFELNDISTFCII